MIKCVKGTLKNKKTGLCEKKIKSSSKSKSRKSSKMLELSPSLEKLIIKDLNIAKGPMPANATAIPVSSIISSKSFDSSSSYQKETSSKNIDPNELYYKIKLISKDKKITEEDIENLNKYLSKFKKGIQVIVKHAPKNKITVEPEIIEELDKIIKLKEKDLPDTSINTSVKPQSNLFLLFLYKLFQFGKYILFGTLNIIKWGIWAFFFKIWQATYILGFKIPQLYVGIKEVNKYWLPKLLYLWGFTGSLGVVALAAPGAIVAAATATVVSASLTIMFMFFNLTSLWEIFKEFYKLFFVWS